MWISGTHLFGLIPDGHGKIIKAAWGKRYGSDFVNMATAANEKFDKQSQSVPESGLHSMTPAGPGEHSGRAESAEKAMENHVATYIELAAQAGANGDVKSKAENMAIGSHPIADSTSPSHGFDKEWAGVVDVVTGIKAMVHIAGELFVFEKKVEETASKLNQFADSVEARQKEIEDAHQHENMVVK
jgi:hypothetical protein